MSKALLVALVIAAGCASTGRRGVEGPECARVHVLNGSWDDVVLRTTVRRLGDVVATQRRTFRVCGHIEQPLVVGVRSIGGRVNYDVRGHGQWQDGVDYTLTIENHPGLSVLHPSFKTER